MDAAGNLKDAAKLVRDVGRIFAGDMSAIKDLIANKLVWEIVLGCVLAVALVGLLLGASFSGLIQYLAQTWAANWEENWTAEAIASGGDRDYLQSTGWLHTIWNTTADSISQVWKDAKNTLVMMGVLEGQGTSDNSQIGDAAIQSAGRNPYAADFDTTVQAVADAIVLDDALIARLEMIKGRVVQRGMQIQKAIEEQYLYGKNSEYQTLMDNLQADLNKKYETEGGELILYGGYDASAAMHYFQKNYDNSPQSYTHNI